MIVGTGAIVVGILGATVRFAANSRVAVVGRETSLRFRSQKLRRLRGRVRSLGALKRGIPLRHSKNAHQTEVGMFRLDRQSFEAMTNAIRNAPNISCPMYDAAPTCAIGG